MYSDSTHIDYAHLYAYLSFAFPSIANACLHPLLEPWKLYNWPVTKPSCQYPVWSEVITVFLAVGYPINVVYGLMLKLEIYNYAAGRSLYAGGFPFLHWQLLLKLSTIQLSPELLQVMSFLISSLIHFSCIGVVPID